jgi:hypothetical protein
LKVVVDDTLVDDNLQQSGEEGVHLVEKRGPEIFFPEVSTGTLKFSTEL